MSLNQELDTVGDGPMLEPLIVNKIHLNRTTVKLELWQSRARQRGARGKTHPYLLRLPILCCLLELCSVLHMQTLSTFMSQVLPPSFKREPYEQQYQQAFERTNATLERLQREAATKKVKKWATKLQGVHPPIL